MAQNPKRSVQPCSTLFRCPPLRVIRQNSAPPPFVCRQPGKGGRSEQISPSENEMG